MRYKSIILVICMFILTSCNVIAGPEEPGGSELPVAPRDTTFHYDQYIAGAPNVDFRGNGGFYIWKLDDNSWHVRVAKRHGISKFQGPVITGMINVEGAFVTDLMRNNLGSLSNIKRMRNNIAFTFDLTEDKVQGFDFHLRPIGVEYCVNLEAVNADDLPAPGIVYLGATVYSPNKLPLNICVYNVK